MIENSLNQFKKASESISLLYDENNRKLFELNKNYSNELEVNNRDYKEAHEINQKIVKDLVDKLNLYTSEAAARKTKYIYRQKYEKYEKYKTTYESYLILLTVITVILVLGQFFAFDYFNLFSLSNVILFKITVIALIATLYTYCFKQIVFYRKIAENAHQTFLELEALPEFINDFPENEKLEIRRELANKYFGKQLFENDSGTNLNEDQLKVSTELFKATSSLIDLAKKSKSDSSNSGNQPQ